MNIKSEIAEEISKAQILVNKLRDYKKGKGLTLYEDHLSMTIFYCNKNCRYSYTYRRFRVEENGEDFPKIIKYKSVNIFLHDLKKYIKELQTLYSKAEKCETLFF